MDFTKQEILDRNGIDFNAFTLEHEYSAKNLLTAMDEYAEQEAKAYASWLSNTVIRGRTASKLWVDYKAEIGPKTEAPTCTTCGSADTYTTTAYHCRRCATTTEM